MTTQTPNSALAVPFRERMIDRARRDEAYALSLIAEALELGAEGHTAEACSILCTLGKAAVDKA